VLLFVFLDGHKNVRCGYLCVGLPREVLVLILRGFLVYFFCFSTGYLFVLSPPCLFLIFFFLLLSPKCKKKGASNGVKKMDLFALQFDNANNNRREVTTADVRLSCLFVPSYHHLCCSPLEAAKPQQNKQKHKRQKKKK
jgi:hypothetical protein